MNSNYHSINNNLGPAITSSEGTPNVSTNDEVNAILHSIDGVDKSVEDDTNEDTAEVEIGDDNSPTLESAAGLALERPLETSNNTKESSENIKDIKLGTNNFIFNNLVTENISFK